MGKAKEIILKVIPANVANNFVKQYHYSKKIVPNSKLHFGAFLNDRLHGVMSYGPSLDKSKTIGLVKDTKWNDFMELNRMAFDDKLPRNSESRCISISIKLIKKNAPNIKWIISYADATQCGDGTIYRASGFHLTSIKKNNHLLRFDDLVVSEMSLTAHGGDKKFYEFLKKNNYVTHEMTLKTGQMKDLVFGLTNGKSSIQAFVDKFNGEVLKGFQLRYIYFIDKSCKDKLTVPIIPFDKIKEMGASMYKGEKRT
jgi:hypothetical protein